MYSRYLESLISIAEPGSITRAARAQIGEILSDTLHAGLNLDNS